MSIKKMVFMVFIATVLGGCATTNCDPTQDGFLGGVGCTLSGGYDKRINARQAELERSKQKQQQAGIEQQALNTEFQSLKGQFENMSADIDNLETELDHMQNASSKDIDKADRLKKEFAKVRKKLAGLKQQQKGGGGGAKVAELKKQANKLQQEVDDLWTIIHAD
ncbi:hypothetical protein PN36_02315 [Candidatus Thiomargarita nelsonii]|uniref:Lipoprotein n=1 Tax=Candidatus Thiomargarita nelsonii TaxID=1003181 RepID=A0A0A6PGI5_9GAMM|nr:hypothetical protein PN36_02315 [Candidatus Thiomargarita nelsonii]